MIIVITMMESYEAFADVTDIMQLTEDLIVNAARDALVEGRWPERLVRAGKRRGAALQGRAGCVRPRRDSSLTPPLTPQLIVRKMTSSAPQYLTPPCRT